MNEKTKIDQSELMNLLKDAMINSEDAAESEMNSIMNNLKEVYVKKRHNAAITYYTGKGRGWRTYIGTGRKERKLIQRSTEEELYSFLYDYYKSQDDTEALKGLSFSELFEMYIAHKTEVLNRSAKTILNERSSFNRFVDEHLGSTKVIDITDEFLSIYLKEKVIQANPRPERLKRFIWLMQNIFTFAIRKRIISENPAVYLDPNDYLKDCDKTRKQDDQKIMSAENIQRLREMEWQNKYNPFSLAILFSIEVGTRVGEIPPLRWSDIENGQIHIHRQQLIDKVKGGWTFHEVDYTKDERRNPHDGRWFPITDAIQEILDACREYQDGLHLEKPSEFIFCYDDGTWIRNTSIVLHLKRDCQKLGFHITNNHALRMSLNSNVLIPAGFDDQQRAYLLGHSVRTNLQFYSHTRRESVLGAKEILNNFSNEKINSAS